MKTYNSDKEYFRDLELRKERRWRMALKIVQIISIIIIFAFYIWKDGFFL